MTRSRMLARTVAAALAIVALAAPMAAAQSRQDLRSPDTRDVAAGRATPSDALAQEMAAHSSSYRSITPAPAPATATSTSAPGHDDGAPVAAIGLGISGACLAGLGVATVGVRRRRTRRARTAA